MTPRSPHSRSWQAALLLLLAPVSCMDGTPSRAAIQDLQLKEGALVSCGRADKELGKVEFEIPNQKEAAAFNEGVALLHSFEYDEAEKVFSGIISRDPGCAMAYWGVAMSNFHPLWAPPTVRELAKGERALQIAERIGPKPAKEEDFIMALSIFYTNWKTVAHATRTALFAFQMQRVHELYPEDKEAAIFYALALVAAADPADTTRKKQREAGELLTRLYPGMPDHPGVIHYLIHAYDYPELAELALPVARRYATVAPSSAHALHMPSHIFTRLGLWEECIQSNLVSVSSAECYAQQSGIRGHWDEELHGLDYLVYAYLQRGEDSMARVQWDYINKMEAVSPANFKVAYAFAAIPARNVLERRDWAAAAKLTVRPVSFEWKDFPWQEAIVHFARGMGAAHLAGEAGHGAAGNTDGKRWLDSANAELKVLMRLYDRLLAEKDAYKAGEVMVQMRALEAWIVLYGGHVKEALEMMTTAVQQEENTEKHPVTPCEVLPARELYADMLLAAGRLDEALPAYEADLKTHPNRLNGLYGAGLAAWKRGDKEKARGYFKRLNEMTVASCGRPEIIFARSCLKSS